MSKLGTTTCSSVLRWTVRIPFLALYGLLVIVVAVGRLALGIPKTMRQIATGIHCPSCGTLGSTANRWGCGRCKAVFHGAVDGPCPICGAYATYFDCDCGISIPLGRRP